MSSSSKRQSIAPSAGPKPPVSFSSSLTIPKDAVLVGTHSITMQAETVVHPKARFDSTLGGILVGRRCIISERSLIGAPPEDRSLASAGGVTMGDYVIVEAGAIVEAGGTEIGEGSLVQIGSKIGYGAKIGKDCTITSRSIILPGEVLPERTVVYSDGRRRTDKRTILEERKRGLLKHINVAKSMIRNDPDKFK